MQEITRGITEVSQRTAKVADSLVAVREAARRNSDVAVNVNRTASQLSRRPTSWARRLKASWARWAA